jgi:hypothetical protein
MTFRVASDKPAFILDRLVAVHQYSGWTQVNPPQTLDNAFYINQLQF